MTEKDSLMRITHLEMTDKALWVRRTSPATNFDVRECVVRQPRLSRFLYEYVGSDWRWTGRSLWSLEQWREYAAAENLRTFVAYKEGSIVGYYELQQQGDSVQITSFGLTPEFIGQGFGGPLLDSAVENAFAWGARRTWLHTCNDDHPNALNNYLKSGFKIFKVEEEPA